MARPIGGPIAEALRSTYTSAGVTQVQIAETLGVKQTTVSSWVRGVNQIPIDALPRIESLCHVPKGRILRRAGYVEDDPADVETAIRNDPKLSEDRKLVLIDAYRGLVGVSIGR